MRPLKKPARLRRGEIYAARLDPVEGSEQGGTRPVLVVSNDLFNEVMPVATVAPLTTYRRPRRHVYPGEVLLASGKAGLRADSLVLCHQIRTVSRSRVGRRIGRLAGSDLAAVDEALRLHLFPA
ncbi:MAG: type II toxin-antitoxin system PemK/MazF family toxin [Acidobacteria bacterium]|nr:type II toxin-antitoxin system PemK/MazF family toxin [Acidobacteriota bacterium]